MLYYLYHLATAASGPFLRKLTATRLAKGKEDPARYTERFGITKAPRPSGKVLWCHGASIGESLSALPLLTTLHARLPHWHFILTTNTMTSAQLLAQRLPPFITHQFVPWDHPKWVENFMHHWQPDAALWLESELWPNTLASLKAHKIPAALLNARMRPKTAQRWGLARGLVAQMLSSFRFILVGARDYRPVFESLGGKNVRYIGSLKFGAKALPVNEAELQTLRRYLGTRRCIGFVSTHEDEETLFATAARALKDAFPDLLIYWVPRQPDRGAAIAQTLEKQKLHSTRRQMHQPITAETDVYIADTIGELGLCYALNPLAVIGGSFAPHGGQNPIEGTHFGTAVLYGPHMFNFPELCAALEQAGAARIIPQESALVPAVSQLLSDPQALAVLQQSSRELATQNVAVIDAFADETIEQLELQ